MHITNTRRVYPSVVELKQGADGNGITEFLVGPAEGLDCINVSLANAVGLCSHFFDERQQRLSRFDTGALE